MELTKRKPKRIGLKGDLIFYCFLLLIPIAQFCIFYIYVNFNSILLAFKDIESVSVNGTYVWKETWSLNGIIDAWEVLKSQRILDATKWSFMFYGLGLIFSLPTGLFFSYYIAKKHIGAGFFRVLLYLPSILSAIVMVTLYTYFVNQAYPTIVGDITGTVADPLLGGSDLQQFFVIFFFNVCTSFGVNVLMYANAMSGIDPEITEAAYLDGATGLKEFWHISLPLVFSTVSVFIITGVATIFTNQHNLFSFYGGDAPIEAFGYYMYVQTSRAKNIRENFPWLSAFGLMMSVVAIPLTFLVKYLLEKFGPKED